MWAEAAKALANYPEAVVTTLDGDGYPVSIRQATSRYDAATGIMPVDWPPAFAVVEGPASILCHYHDEKLWNMSTLHIKGRMEPRGDGWDFVSTAFTPPPGRLLMVWRLATGGRTAAHRYLDKRGLAVPAVNWDAVGELWRRARERRG